MATDPRSGTGGSPAAPKYDAGQRVGCQQCGAEVEVLSPCTCDPPEMVLQCCGEPMSVMPGKRVNLGVE